MGIYYITSLINTAVETETIWNMWNVCVLETRNPRFHAHITRNNAKQT